MTHSHSTCHGIRLPPAVHYQIMTTIRGDIGLPGELHDAQPPTAYTTSPTVGDFLVSPADFLAARPHISNIIAGTIIFNESLSGPKILLLRRAPSDSFPLQWEIPAGTADPSTDRSITDVAVRELWEETHLRARRLVCPVGLKLPKNMESLASVGEVRNARMDSQLPICLLDYSGSTWGVVTFFTKVEDIQADIILQDKEHIEWAWASEIEVTQGYLHGSPRRALEFVSGAMKMVILEGFRIKQKFNVNLDLLSNES